LPLLKFQPSYQVPVTGDSLIIVFVRSVSCILSRNTAALSYGEPLSAKTARDIHPTQVKSVSFVEKFQTFRNM